MGNRSFRLAVLARDGRGGGAVPFMRMLSPLLVRLAAKGSRSMFLDTLGVGKLCFRGGAFWRELRTRGSFLATDGGAGACLEG